MAKNIKPAPQNVETIYATQAEIDATATPVLNFTPDDENGVTVIDDASAQALLAAAAEHNRQLFAAHPEMKTRLPGVTRQNDLLNVGFHIHSFRADVNPYDKTGGKLVIYASIQEWGKSRIKEIMFHSAGIVSQILNMEPEEVTSGLFTIVERLDKPAYNGNTQKSLAYWEPTDSPESPF